MKITKEDKQMLLEQYRKTWRNEDSAQWSANKVSAFIWLGGTLITFDKPSIETRFCFGEHGYDYDEVNQYCQDVSEDEQWFIKENMNRTEAAHWLEVINDTGYSYYTNDIVCATKAYYDQPKDCALGYLRLRRKGEFDPRDGFILNEEEKKRLVEVLEEEQEKFEKRLRSYLKRYGLSKCHFWTYWADR